MHRGYAPDKKHFTFKHPGTEGESTVYMAWKLGVDCGRRISRVILASSQLLNAMFAKHPYNVQRVL